MSRRCSIDPKKGVAVGNKISHSNRKTKRKFLPNLQSASIYSDSMKKFIKLRVSTKSLRTIEHNGGIDNYLFTTPNSKLSSEALRVKKMIEKIRSAA